MRQLLPIISKPKDIISTFDLVIRNTYLQAKFLWQYKSIALPILFRQLFYNIYKFPSLHHGSVRTLPYEIVALISRKCFLSCVTCGAKAMYGSDKKFTDFIDTSLLRRIADELASWKKLVYVKMTGGEPAMHPDLFDILEYYTFRGIPIRLSTNGVFFSLKERASALVEAGLEVITISLDGIPEKHNTIRRGKNLYTKVAQAIAYIKERKKQLNTRKPMIQVATIVSQTNYDSLPQFVTELEELGVDWLQIGFVQYVRDAAGLASQRVCRELGGVGDDKWLFWRDSQLMNITGIDPYVLEGAFKEVFSRPRSFPISVVNIGGLNAEDLKRYHFTDEVIHHNLCSNPYVSMVILPPGLATFCIDFPQFFYGDLREKSLAEIWFSDKAQELRRKFLNYYQQHGQNMPHCLRCGWRFW